MISLVEVILNVGTGQRTRVWEDTWLGGTPQAKKYPSMYNIVGHNFFVLPMSL
jgi:hypothetical protein